ncbi:MAG: PAS domain S-box protein [Candidatus Riflebacteria bacterium]|nr:PAS domain S-box protein [Candidatus Riflebacteria bacterium]
MTIHRPTRQGETGATLFTDLAVQALESGAMPIIWVGADGGFRFVNSGARAYLGYSPSDLEPLHLWDIDVNLTPDLWQTGLSRLVDQRNFHFETLHRTKDGREVPVEVRGHAARGPGETVLCCFVQVLSEPRPYHVALAADEERYRLVTEQAGQLIYEWNIPTGSIQNWGAITAITGYDPAELRRFAFQERLDALIHPDDRDRVLEHLEIGQTVTGKFQAEYRLRRKDGTWTQVEDRGVFLNDGTDSPQRLLGLMQDITARKEEEAERRRLEARMMQAQKLESLGVMASGIAHDFNNLLGAMLGNLDLLHREIPDTSPLHRRVLAARKASQRAAELCRQLLTYTGKSHQSRVALDLNTLVRELGTILEVAVTKKTSLELALQPDLPMIRGDPGEIHQVILNLVLNAAEALEGTPGTITLATGLRACERAFLDHTWGKESLPEGRYVFFEVTDPGPGMSPETLQRIFDPFFSTRFPGRGLGLPTVLGIVRSLGGGILVDSSPGRGSRFTVLLPPAPPTLPVPAPPAQAEVHGTGTVLVVDDEELIRTTAEDMLGFLGYGCLTAATGEEAVALLEQHQAEGADPGGKVDCVLLDLTMPGMGGPRTLAAIRERWPTLPVLLASGYSREEVATLLGDLAPVEFSPKPFNLDLLGTHLARAMGRRPPDRPA